MTKRGFFQRQKSSRATEEEPTRSIFCDIYEASASFMVSIHHKRAIDGTSTRIRIIKIWNNLAGKLWGRKNRAQGKDGLPFEILALR